MWGGIYRVSFIGCGEIRDFKKYAFIEARIEDICEELIGLQRMVEFRVCRENHFDRYVASAVRRAQKSRSTENSDLILVVSQDRNEKSFVFDFYDRIEHPIISKGYLNIGISSSERWLVHNCDLIICYFEDNSYNTDLLMNYADEYGVEIYNIADEMN